MLPSAASNSTVPSDGFVVTPEINEPTRGMAFWMDCVIPAAVQSMFATSDPIEPPESAVSSNRTSLTVTSAFMPLKSRI